MTRLDFFRKLAVASLTAPALPHILANASTPHNIPNPNWVPAKLKHHLAYYFYHDGTDTFHTVIQIDRRPEPPGIPENWTKIGQIGPSLEQLSPYADLD